MFSADGKPHVGVNGGNNNGMGALAPNANNFYPDFLKENQEMTEQVN